MILYSEVNRENYYDSITIALIKKRGSAKFPTNDELRTSLENKDLRNIKSKSRNYMFKMLENHNNRKPVDTSNKNITIEHIFPQTPNNDWKRDLTSEDFLLLKENYLDTIANLTLSGNNGSLSNKSFSEKQSMNNNSGEQSYKYSRLWLNTFLKEINIWNIENYKKRFEIIYNRFLNIWKYPDIKLPENEEEKLECNLFNAENPTGKKLEYFIFENIKIEENIIV